MSNYMQAKRQPIVKIENKQIIFEDTKDSSKISLVKEDVNKIILYEIKDEKIIGIKLKDPRKYIEKTFSKTKKRRLLYDLLIYFRLKINKTPIKYVQFSSNKKEDRIQIIYNVQKLNEKKANCHLFLLKRYYKKDFDSLYKDLKRVLS